MLFCSLARRLFVLPLLAAGLLLAEPPNYDSGRILNAYFAAARGQQDRLNGSTAEIRIDAEIPKLHKHGRLSALRHVSRLGRLTYDVLRFEGDNSVKSDVIARYLTAEAQARESNDSSMAIIPGNYNFSYKGARVFEGRKVHVFALKPRHKSKGLFKGQLWVDAQTFLPVREAGSLVKSPSVFIKKVEFTRDYETTHGLAVLARMETTVETRVVGPAHMTVEYADYHFDGPADEDALASADSQ
jgi:hypothetical protein